MQDKLSKIKKQFEKELLEVKDFLHLDEIDQKFFSRKSGEFTSLMKDLGAVAEEKRKEFGKLINETKSEVEALFANKKQELEKQKMASLASVEWIDVTQPSLAEASRGHLHPNTQIQFQLEDFFRSMGFMVQDGPELESDFYNFTALNIPSDHPARDMQDTLYIKGHSDWLMRTQTSPMQIRAMKKFGVPLRLVVPGRVFRNESTDPRHEHTFYQVEGVVIDKEINFSHMKGVLEAVAKFLYGPETEVRMRPKFYPFVEPGVNGEVTCFLCKGKGCRVCKQTGWLEVFGAGMIHKNVLKEGGVDSEEYQGFAFGLGLSRLVMLKYGIEDVRHFQSGDLRFLNQF